MAEIAPISVSQGSTHDDGGYNYCCLAEYAIDRDLRTWSATNTDNGAGWLKIDIDGTQFIHKIIIHYRFFSYPYNPNDHCVNDGRFNGCVDNENNVDASVYQGDVKQKSCGSLQLTYGLEQSDQIYTLICNIRGDTVKLSKNTGNIIVRELVVIGAGTIHFQQLETV